MAMGKLARARAAAATARKRAAEEAVEASALTCAGAFGYGLARARGMVPGEVLGLDTGAAVGAALAAASMFGAVPRRWRARALGVASGVSAPYFYELGAMTGTSGG